MLVSCGPVMLGELGRDVSVSSGHDCVGGSDSSEPCVGFVCMTAIGSCTPGGVFCNAPDLGRAGGMLGAGEGVDVGRGGAIAPLDRGPEFRGLRSMSSSSSSGNDCVICSSSSGGGGGDLSVAPVG